MTAYIRYSKRFILAEPSSKRSSTRVNDCSIDLYRSAQTASWTVKRVSTSCSMMTLIYQSMSAFSLGSDASALIAVVEVALLINSAARCAALLLSDDGSLRSFTTRLRSSTGSRSNRFAAPPGVFKASVKTPIVFAPILFSKIFNALFVVVATALKYEGIRSFDVLSSKSCFSASCPALT